MNISIIIPVYNEADVIGKLVRYLHEHGGRSVEIIVVDAGSTDATPIEAEQAGARVLVSPTKGRAAQMNHGAAAAQHPILYFVHADTFPPPNFLHDIGLSIASGYALGRYRTRFDASKPLLKLNAWFTRFDLFICYGGDQTLFITRSLFDAIGGFNNQMRIMEEYDLVERARKSGRYRIIPDYARISARKYDTNSWLRVQMANYHIMRMYRKGASQDAMVQQYKTLLRYR